MKLGRIQVSREMYNECWYPISKMFEQFKPYHIDNSDQRTLVFYGESESFDDVSEGSEIPFYDVVFDTREAGVIKYWFDKK